MTTSSLRRLAVAGGIGAIAIAAAGIGFATLADNDAGGATATPSVLAGPFPTPTGDTPNLASDTPPLPPPPPTPEAAAAAFVAAEQRDDHDASFALLAADEREAYGNAQEWASAHDELPIIVGFTATGPAAIDGGEAVLAGRLELVPVVDEVIGVVPAAAAAEFALVAEDGGWRVDFARSIFVPEFPDVEQAVPAAAEWVADRQACRFERNGYDGNLIGDPRVEAVLCETTGEFVPGEPGRVDDLPDAAPFLSTFGPDGVAALATVPFDGPAPLTVVLAPLGAGWVVVGAE